MWLRRRKLLSTTIKTADHGINTKRKQLTVWICPKSLSLWPPEFPLAAIESSLNKDLRLIRVMPNIAASVKEGAAAIAPGKHALKSDLKISKAIFDSVGQSVIIEENLMDAITGLSGSGPAYIFLIVDALADAGVKMGLSREDALFLSGQTVLGAAKLLMETHEHPGN